MEPDNQKAKRSKTDNFSYTKENYSMMIFLHPIDQKYDENILETLNEKETKCNEYENEEDMKNMVDMIDDLNASTDIDSISRKSSEGILVETLNDNNEAKIILIKNCLNSKYQETISELKKEKAINMLTMLINGNLDYPICNKLITSPSKRKFY